MRIRVANSLVVLLYTALGVATGFAFTRFSAVQQRQIEASRRELEATRAVAAFLAGSRRLTSNLQAFAATGDEQFAEAFWREVAVTRSRERAADTLDALGLTAAEGGLLLRARAESDALIARQGDVVAARRGGELDRALALVFGADVQQALRRIDDPSEELQQRITVRLAAEVARERRAAAVLWALCLGLVLVDLLLVLVLVVLAVVYPRFITQPLVQLDRRLQGLSAGLPTAPLQLRWAATEIRDLAASLATQERLAAQLAQDRWAKAQHVRIGALLQRQASRSDLAATLLRELAAVLPIGAATAYGLAADAAHGADAPLQLLASYAVSGRRLPRHLQPGEGLLGECLRRGEPLDVLEPPAGYLAVTSGLGHCDPQQLLLLPVQSGSRILAVVELALLRQLLVHERALLIDLLPLVALALEGLEPMGVGSPPILPPAP